MSQDELYQNKSYISKKIKIKRLKFLNYYIPQFIKYLTHCLTKVNGVNNYENPDGFEDFGPILLSNDEDKHSKRIKYAIDNPSILNLALTGPFGSGKSTILKTFENKNLQYNYLNISLATFDKKTLDTDKIEHNILKQLFYSVEHKRIPESRFKRIENLKGIKTKTFLFILWLFSLSYFLKLDMFNELINTLHLKYSSSFLSIIYGVYFLIYSSVLVYKLMSFVLNFKLTKFKLKDVDFDNDQDKKTINFENEIDEILYFFERNPIDIVFFQDLDRFKDSIIFIKLREINNLINNYEPIKKNRKVTFIYAISDDIFKENERTKFFDFIIPVIPVINYTSSSSKLLSKLKPDIQNKKLSKDFIDDVSLFLNDYRTIKSILNEYQIYKTIIGEQLDDYNNLLAMMIYKNIEPTDFDKLNSNQGYVYNIVDNAKDLTNGRMQYFNDQISELKIKLSEVSNENLKNITELRMLYILKFFEIVTTQNNYPIYGINLQNKRCTIEDLLTDEFFDLFKIEVNISFFHDQYSRTSSSISFIQIEKSVDKIKYSERLEIVRNKQTDNLNQLKSELQEFENKKKELNSKKLHEILDDYNSIEYFEKYKNKKEKINNFKLINYLVSEGYINEGYNHYISHFHPGSITVNDNNFLLSLLPSEKQLPYNHKLKEINNLIKRIKPENYNNEAILNLNLLDYLIENKKTGKLNSIINLISKENEKSLSFIDDYLNESNENNKCIFFKTLSNNWSELWNFLVTKSNFPPDKIEQYLIYIFQCLDLQAINNLDKKSKLSNHISKLQNLDCFDDKRINFETLKKFLKNSSVEFENLTFKIEHKNLFEFIYDNNIYEINEKMIELYISNFNLNNTNIQDLKTSNYTTIKNSKKVKMINFIDANLEVYLHNIFLRLENNTNESQDSMLIILNNEQPQIEILKDTIIEKGEFLITDLSKIEEIEIQTKLLIEQKTCATWKNIITYYKKSKEINESLLGYLNLEHNYNILSKQPLFDDEDKGVKTSFQKDLIKSDVSDQSFSKLCHNLPFAYKNGSEFIGISILKIKSLIESKRILLSKENYNMINDEYPDLLLYLLEKNIVDFMKSIAEYTLDSSIILAIIKSKVFNSSHKLSILESIPDGILLENKNLLKELSDFLLSNKISIITPMLLIELISNSASNKNKVELINQYFNFIDNGNLILIIEKIEEFSKLLIGKRPKVDDTEYNNQLILNLEDKLISHKKVLLITKQIELFPFIKKRI